MCLKQSRTHPCCSSLEGNMIAACAAPSNLLQQVVRLANVNSHANKYKASVCNRCPACFPDSLPITVAIDSCTPVTLIRHNQPLTENGWMDRTFWLSLYTICA